MVDDVLLNKVSAKVRQMLTDSQKLPQWLASGTIDQRLSLPSALEDVPIKFPFDL